MPLRRLWSGLPWVHSVVCWWIGSHDFHYVNTYLGRAVYRCQRCGTLRTKYVSTRRPKGSPGASN